MYVYYTCIIYPTPIIPLFNVHPDFTGLPPSNLQVISAYYNFGLR